MIKRSLLILANIRYRVLSYITSQRITLALLGGLAPGDLLSGILGYEVFVRSMYFVGTPFVATGAEC